MVRSFCKCLRLHLRRLMFSKKTVLLLVLLGFFSSYIFMPLNDICRFYGFKVAPWLMPFYLSMSSMVVLNAVMVLLLFCDVGSLGDYENYVIVRSGRRPFLMAEFAAVWITSFAYAGVIFLFSILYTLPVLGWDADWGIIIRTLAESAAEVQNQVGVTFSLVVSPKILSLFTPMEATALSVICITCSSAFLGTVIASFRVLFGRSAAFTAGTALSGLSIFVNAIGKLIIGGWMQYISPLTWANINYIDWFSSGTYPGPAYVFSFWGIGTAALIALSFWKIARGDLGKDEASL